MDLVTILIAGGLIGYLLFRKSEYAATAFLAGVVLALPAYIAFMWLISAVAYLMA